jgi:4-amino-4-deoxy-L-arabinose transferase-like glycosyltransferase
MQKLGAHAHGPALAGSRRSGGLAPAHAHVLVSAEQRFAAFLFFAVFASRALTSSTPYFADAFRHLAAISNHTYVIQAPGYWLFNRIAGLFPNPARAISVLNWLFSAAGTATFYLAVRRLASESLARLSSVAYGTVFFAWMSGNVHSTYASQLYFPVAVSLCFLHYRETPRFVWAAAAAILFAVGAGFRPSDGAFFAPAFLYGLSHCKRRHALASLPVVIVLCLAWLVPQQMALSRQVDPLERNLGSHLGAMAGGVLVIGFSRYALSNAIRLVLPFVLAFLPLLPLIFGNRRQPYLWIWILPGMAFYLLIYFPIAPYLGYILAAILMLAVTNPAATERTKLALFATCIVVNVAFYFAWTPMTFRSHALQLGANVIQADAGNFTYYGVQHHYAPRLSELLHMPGYGEPAQPAVQRR